MKEFRILVIVNDEFYTKIIFEETKKASVKADVIRNARNIAMNACMELKKEISYSVHRDGFLIFKGRIVPHITYKYEVDFKLG